METKDSCITCKFMAATTTMFQCRYIPPLSVRRHELPSNTALYFDQASKFKCSAHEPAALSPPAQKGE